MYTQHQNNCLSPECVGSDSLSISRNTETSVSERVMDDFTLDSHKVNTLTLYPNAECRHFFCLDFLRFTSDCLFVFLCTVLSVWLFIFLSCPQDKKKYQGGFSKGVWLSCTVLVTTSRHFKNTLRSLKVPRREKHVYKAQGAFIRSEDKTIWPAA